MQTTIKKPKIVNDPVYGFITISDPLAFEIIEHPWFQRLRHIKQLSLSYLVYPGAMHTRFQHTLGAMHLMGLAIDALRVKGCEITPDEAQAVTIAILLHDIGHGPFSHTLEHTILPNVSHEQISLLLMQRLNQQLGGRMEKTMQIFTGEYEKPFLHQLVSSQLDVDRLDYLRRDSFFTGVTEGVIGIERIIKMLNVVDNKLVVEVKGIYSIEKFLIARRIMYWQVYLHKTVVAADQMLQKIFERAKELANKGVELFASPALQFFLQNKIESIEAFTNTPEAVENFCLLDDTDLICAIKVWQQHPDRILSFLCQSLMNRRLLRAEIKEQAFSFDTVAKIRQEVCQRFGVTDDEVGYLVFSDALSNNAYKTADDKINILYNDGALRDITEASDLSNLSTLSRTVVKYFLCYPKIDFTQLKK